MLYLDNRMGASEQWPLDPQPDDRMRISDIIVKCVAFLCLKKTDGGAITHPAFGTAFFLLFQEKEGGPGWVYIVTAKHTLQIAETLRQNAPDTYGDIFVRVNTKAGGVKLIKTVTKWTLSDSADLAIAPFKPRNEVTLRPTGIGAFDMGLIPSDILATSEKIVERSIGIGDEIVIAGLFSRVVGTQQNFPVVRGGIIAAMPNEKELLRTKYPDGTYFDAPGFLIEAKSFGGLSGAPVIAMLDSFRLPDGTIAKKTNNTFLLGVVRGHWAHKTPDWMSEQMSRDFAEVNQGIAIVTPAEDLKRLLHAPELTRLRDEDHPHRDAADGDMSIEDVIDP